MIKLHIAEVLQEKGITKTEFAKLMGIQKQNVNSLLETNNIRKIEEIAEKLGVKFSDLIDVGNTDPQPEVTGFVEVSGVVYRIRSKADIEELLNKIE